MKVSKNIPNRCSLIASDKPQETSVRLFCITRQPNSTNKNKYSVFSNISGFVICSAYRFVSVTNKSKLTEKETKNR